MIIKICRRAKNRESRRRLRQSAAAKNRAAGLTSRRCDVGLTLRYDTIRDAILTCARKPT